MADRPAYEWHDDGTLTQPHERLTIDTSGTWTIFFQDIGIDRKICISIPTAELPIVADRVAEWLRSIGCTVTVKES